MRKVLCSFSGQVHYLAPTAFTRYTGYESCTVAFRPLWDWAVQPGDS